MPDDATPVLETTLLVVHRLSQVRKVFQKRLEAAGERVLAVESLGAAIPRLRARRYELLLCTDPPTGSRWVEDYGRIVKKSGMVARGVGHEIWTPGDGIQCDAVVIVPGTDADALHAAVLAARAGKPRPAATV
jgi:hypothetical protein